MWHTDTNTGETPILTEYFKTYIYMFETNFKKKSFLIEKESKLGSARWLSG